jgi:ABC-2 type transport system permease protein
LVSSLSDFYEVQAYNMKRTEPIPKECKILIIAKPDSTFTEWVRYKIDNFVMRGGKVLWLMDQVDADMDSLRGKLEFLAQPKNLNIDDMLFKYGVRVNYDLIQDLKCTPIPVVVGQVGNRPQTELRPWYYFPLITPNGEHPISKNLDPIQVKFANTLDIIDNQVSKQVLLTSSRYTRVVMAPTRIHLGQISEKINPKQFNKPNKPVAVLMEGKFPSVFSNRMFGSFAQQVIDSLKMPAMKESVETKMIVVSDGDIAANYVNKANGSVAPLGFDRFTNQLYGNKPFLLNCIDYLADDSGFMQIRSKEITLRMLNPQKIQKNKSKWQMLNTLVPISIMLAFGFVYTYRRRAKFAKK